MPRARAQERRPPVQAAAEHAAGHAPAPLVDFSLLDRAIAQRLEEAEKYMGKFHAIPSVKRASKAKLIRSGLFKPGWGGWDIAHPVRLFGKIATSKLGKVEKTDEGRVLNQPGRFAAKSEKAIMGGAAALRTPGQGQGIQQHFQSLYAQFERNLNAAKDQLRAKADSGELRSDNKGEHVKIYNQAVDKAWLEFRERVHAALKEYRQAAVKKGVIKGQPFYIKAKH